MIKFKNRINLIYLLMIFIIATVGLIKTNNTPTPYINKGFISLYKEIFNDNKNILLNGNWEYYDKKFIIPKDIQFFSSEKNFSELKNIKKNSFGTYCLEFATDDTSVIYGMDIPSVYGSYEIYLNGEKIADNGVLNSKDEIFSVNFNGKIVPLKITEKRNSIVVYIANNSYKIGGFKEYIKIGKYSDIIKDNENRNSFIYILIGIIFLMVTYQIFLYYLKRECAETLYFLLCALSVLLLALLRLNANFFTGFYINFMLELLLKIVIPLLLLKMNKELKDKSISNLKLKYVIIILFLFIFIKKEQHITVNLLYVFMNIISAAAFYYNIVIMKKIKEKECKILELALYAVIAGLIYASILSFYGKNFEYDIALITVIIIIKAMLVIKNISDEYSYNILAAKELDMNKEKLEKIVFYKSMMMEKEKLKWNNFIKHFKEIAIIVDEDGNIIECNPATIKFFEVFESDILNKKIWDIEFRYTPEEEKTLTNYHEIKRVYIDLIEDITHFSKEKREIKRIENENGKIKEIDITRFSILLKTGKMIGVIIREINTKKEDFKYKLIKGNLNEESGISIFSIEDILELISSHKDIMELTKNIEIESSVKIGKKLIGNKGKIAETIIELILMEEKNEVFKKLKLKLENISEGKDYIILSVKMLIIRKPELNRFEMKIKNKFESRQQQIKEEIEKMGGKLNILNKNYGEKEISFYIKIKKYENRI